MAEEPKCRSKRNKAKRRTHLPDKLLVQIGRIAAVSAYIEQEVVLWASALFAKDTDGKPIEWLRMEFSRLRKKWYSRAKKDLDKITVQKFIDPINSDLAKAWRARGAVIHGQWEHVRGWQYRVSYWDQRDTLRHFSHTYTLRELRKFADSLERLLKDIYRVSRGR